MPELKKLILCIDDYKPFRMLTRIHLENAGYKVYTASNGKDGISRAQARNFDLIILDLIMPEFDGFSVFNKLEELSIASRTPILVLTCLGLEKQVQELLNKGAYHLKKDDANDLLVPTVKELIG
jgi:CheY-like chemotaxis protein